MVDALDQTATLTDWPAWSKRFIHPEFGLIRSLFTHPVPSEFPRLFLANAVASNPYRAAGCKEPSFAASYHGYGIGERFEDAARIACAEAVERYAAAIWYPDELIEGTGEHMPAPSDELAQRSIFWRGNYAPYRRGERRQWITLRRWSDGHPVPYPAQPLLWGYEFPRGERLSQSTSNGYSAGATLDQALLGGLYELIERDAFVCHWLLRRTPKRLRVDLIRERGVPEALSTFLLDRRIDVNFLLLENEFAVPVVLCLMRKDGHSVVGLGASARLNVGTAVAKALNEAYISFLQELLARVQGHGVLARAAVRTFTDHPAYFRDRKRLASLSYLYLGPWTPTPPQVRRMSAADEIAQVGERLAAHDFTILYQDTTRTDIADAGLRTVKVVVPGLQPLYVGSAYPRDFRRVRQFARRVGAEARIRPVSSIHPFP